jgi:hypothetical protein
LENPFTIARNDLQASGAKLQIFIFLVFIARSRQEPLNLALPFLKSHNNSAI